MKSLVLLSCACLLVGLSSHALAWSNHSLGSLLALREMPELRQDVTVEPLEAFLADQAPAIERLLDEQERYAREHFSYYPPRPDQLRWQAAGGGDRRTAFLQALRVNPEIKLASFIQQLPGQDAGGRPLLGGEDVLVFHKVGPWTHWRYLGLKDGEKVAALQVVASAADEPDYGHDINLFSDNPGAVGQRYNFGPQPFGDARFEYSSQAPFHIGYYHESALIFAAAPYLGQTLPHWRVYQYSGLARLAFASGHPYWGYRFLGWAMHYLQDLTQPYHASVLPGVDTAGMVLIAAKAEAGYPEDREAAIKRVADRHTAIEQYQFDRMQSLLESGQAQHPLLTAYAERDGDADYPAFDVDYAAQVVAAESHERAGEFDALIGEWLARGDTAKGFSEGNRLQAVEPDPALEALLVQLFRHFGAHSRNALSATVPKQ
ncbi:phospholipase [Pseudomonas sp. SO81]|uniref:phospholipase n=1 Tax=Pseudomonas sp. SO81 TaxID=2983246 RepID=UPI0025A44CEF|nr:phospholipase [Pseudomonas sp. SO81]WJN61063.1 Broad-substrate range phospholipase C [Pseudomonas sp. SO81]